MSRAAVLFVFACACGDPAPPEAPASAAPQGLRPEMIRLELHNQDTVRAWERDGGAVLRWSFGADAVFTLAERDENGNSRGVRLDELAGLDGYQLREKALAELEQELGTPKLEPADEPGIYRLIIEQGPPPADTLLVHRGWKSTLDSLGGELYAIVPSRGEVQLGGPGTACTLFKRIGPAVVRNQESVSHIVFRWAPRGWEPVFNPCAGPATDEERALAKRYFPSWDDERALAVSQYLEAMEEPPLAELATDGATVVRVLWIPKLEKPVAARVTVLRNGDATLAARRLGGLGGYGPGALEHQEDRPLNPTELSQTNAALAALNLAAMKPATAAPKAEGSRWVLEIAGPDGVYAVERVAPKADGPDAAFHAMGRELLEFAGAELTAE